MELTTDVKKRIRKTFWIAIVLVGIDEIFSTALYPGTKKEHKKIYTMRLIFYGSFIYFFFHRLKVIGPADLRKGNKEKGTHQKNM